MILIDSTYVVSKGGVNILKVFLNSIKLKDRKKFIVFLDERTQLDKSFLVNFHCIKFIKGNLIVRQFYYLKIKNKIKVIVNFSNIPL